MASNQTFMLDPTPPLGGYHRDLAGLHVSEVDNLGIMSLAATPGDQSAVAAIVASGTSTSQSDVLNPSENTAAVLPKVGSSWHSASGDVQVLGLQPDHWMLLFEPANHPFRKQLACRFAQPSTAQHNILEANAGSRSVVMVDDDASAYVTDQSDAWACARLTGARSRQVLERLTMLNVAPLAFPPGRVARTLVHHLTVILIAEAAETWKLLSPRSSAQSFCHALDSVIQ